MWVQHLNRTLVIPDVRSPNVLDLFAGCGGLALGFEAAGFETIGFEKDIDASETYRANLKGTCATVELSVGYDYPIAPVIIGGPPCQPFSVGGLQLGLKDSRDGFPIFLDAISRLQPEIWLFENVRGMLYANKKYFEEILQTLKSLEYIVEFKLLNAVSYGVPQNRERVIVIGHRGDFVWPTPQSKKVTAGDALGDYATTAPEESKFLTASMDQYVAKYEKASSCIRPRDLHLEKPARTLTCRNLAGATGDMQRIKLPDGRRRRLLVREAARLQSFPDSFDFSGSEISQFNQIGNAVPPLFAKEIAQSVRRYLESGRRHTSSEIANRNLPSQMELSLLIK